MTDPLTNHTNSSGREGGDAGERMFRIMDGPDIPWAMIAPHEAQAQANHSGQSLEGLHARGGLSPDEAVAVLEDRKYAHMVPKQSLTTLQIMVRDFRRETSPPPDTSLLRAYAEASELLKTHGKISITDFVKAKETLGIPYYQSANDWMVDLRRRALATQGPQADGMRKALERISKGDHEQLPDGEYPKAFMEGYRTGIMLIRRIATEALDKALSNAGGEGER